MGRYGEIWGDIGGDPAADQPDEYGEDEDARREAEVAPPPLVALQRGAHEVADDRDEERDLVTVRVRVRVRVGVRVRLLEANPNAIPNPTCPRGAAHRGRGRAAACDQRDHRGARDSEIWARYGGDIGGAARAGARDVGEMWGDMGEIWGDTVEM